MGAIDELPRWARTLLDDEPVAHLAYVGDDDRPRVLPVTFALAGGAVVSAIDDKPKRTLEPARVGALRRRPHAALCVDRYDEDWSRLAWVQLRGAVEVLEVADAPAAIAALTARYAAYRDRPPPGPVLRLAPVRVRYWRAVDAATG